MVTWTIAQRLRDAGQKSYLRPADVVHLLLPANTCFKPVILMHSYYMVQEKRKQGT